VFVELTDTQEPADVDVMTLKLDVVYIKSIQKLNICPEVLGQISFSAFSFLILIATARNYQQIITIYLCENNSAHSDYIEFHLELSPTRVTLKSLFLDREMPED
jgi:hypothetical protein